jgi:predicted alpha/beta hydrolase family esterase
MNQASIYQQKSTIGRAHPFQMLNRCLSSVAPSVAAMAAEQLFVTVFRHKRPAREKRWAEGAVRFTVPSPHGDLAAWKWGHGPKTVLLVHGWGGRGLQMGAFVEPLVDAGYRVVAYDAPSHGRSPGRQANLFKLTDGLAAVSRAMGPVHGVIAHSLGTTATLLAASRGELKPDRFVAVAPMADTRTMSRHYAEMTGFSREVVDEMRRRFERRLAFRWDDIEPMNLARHLQTEALVIHDRDDRELPAAEAEELATTMPSARSMITTGLGHRRILRDAATIGATTDFISYRWKSRLKPGSQRTMAVAAA